MGDVQNYHWKLNFDIGITHDTADDDRNGRFMINKPSGRKQVELFLCSRLDAKESSKVSSSNEIPVIERGIPSQVFVDGPGKYERIN